jgi:hypothetical protein
MFCSEYILPLVSAAAISISGELSFDSYQDVTSPTFLHGEFVEKSLTKQTPFFLLKFLRVIALFFAACSSAGSLPSLLKEEF